MSVHISQEKFSFVLEILTEQCNNRDFCTVGAVGHCPFPKCASCLKITKDDWHNFLTKNEEDGEGEE